MFLSFLGISGAGVSLAPMTPNDPCLSEKCNFRQRQMRNVLRELKACVINCRVCDPISFILPFSTVHYFPGSTEMHVQQSLTNNAEDVIEDLSNKDANMKASEVSKYSTCQIISLPSLHTFIYSHCYFLHLAYLSLYPLYFIRTTFAFLR